MWLISTRLKLSWHLRVHVLLQKAGKVAHQNHDFLGRYNCSKLKEKAFFFLRWRVGDEHERLCRIQDHNHGQIQHHHRCESKVCWDVYRVISMYKYLTASVHWYRGFLYRFESAWLLVQIPSPPSSM